MIFNLQRAQHSAVMEAEFHDSPETFGLNVKTVWFKGINMIFLNTLAREAGSLTVDLHLSLVFFKSNALVSPPAL